MRSVRADSSHCLDSAPHMACTSHFLPSLPIAAQILKSLPCPLELLISNQQFLLYCQFLWKSPSVFFYLIETWLSSKDTASPSAFWCCGCFPSPSSLISLDLQVCHQLLSHSSKLFILWFPVIYSTTTPVIIN